MGITLNVITCEQAQVLTALSSLMLLLPPQSEDGNAVESRDWTPENPKVNSIAISSRLE